MVAPVQVNWYYVIPLMVMMSQTVSLIWYTSVLLNNIPFIFLYESLCCCKTTQ